MHDLLVGHCFVLQYSEVATLQACSVMIQTQFSRSTEILQTYYPLLGTTSVCAVLQVMVRLNGCYSIAGFTLHIGDPRKAKCVRRLRLSYCSQPISELQELRSASHLWQHALECHVAPCQTELQVELELPVMASCLMVEFTDFHVSLQEAASETLTCPRCSHIVTDKHGVCSCCKENAYQCRHCRHISYDAPDAFLCSECGYSRRGRFEFSLSAGPAWQYAPVKMEQQHAAALAHLQSCSEDLSHKLELLDLHAQAVLHLLQLAGYSHTSGWSADRSTTAAAGSSHGGGAATGNAATASSRGSGSGAGTESGTSKGLVLNPSISQLEALYGDKCKAAYAEALHAARCQTGVQNALLTCDATYSATSSSSSSRIGRLSLGVVQLQPPAGGYAHAAIHLATALRALKAMLDAAPAAVAAAVAGAGAVSVLMQGGLKGLPAEAAATTCQVLALLSQHSQDAKVKLLQLLEQRAMFCIGQYRALDVGAVLASEMQVLEQIAEADLGMLKQQSAPQPPPNPLLTRDGTPCSSSGSSSSSAFDLIIKVLKHAVQQAPSHGGVGSHVVLPCLRVLHSACKAKLYASTLGATAAETAVVSGSSSSINTVAAGRNQQEAGVRDADATAGASIPVTIQLQQTQLQSVEVNPAIDNTLAHNTAPAVAAVAPVSEPHALPAVLQPATVTPQLPMSPPLFTSPVNSALPAPAAAPSPEELEQRKVAEYLSRRASQQGSSSSSRLLNRPSNSLLRRQASATAYSSGHHQAVAAAANSATAMAPMLSSPASFQVAAASSIAGATALPRHGSQGAPGGGQHAGVGVSFDSSQSSQCTTGTSGQTTGQQHGQTSQPNGQSRQSMDRLGQRAAPSPPKPATVTQECNKSEATTSNTSKSEPNRSSNTSSGATSPQLCDILQLLLLHPACQAVRKEAACILKLLYPLPAAMLQVLLRLLPVACSSGKAGDQFFALLDESLGSTLAVTGSTPTSSTLAVTGSTVTTGAGTSGTGSQSPSSQATAAPGDCSQSDSEGPATLVPQLVAAVTAQLVLQVEQLLSRETLASAPLLPGYSSTTATPASTLTPPAGSLPTMLLMHVPQSGDVASAATEAACYAADASYTLDRLSRLLLQLAAKPEAVALMLQQDQNLGDLLWCSAGLDALIVCRSSSIVATADLLKKLLTERLLTADEGSRRLLAQAALRQLAYLHGQCRWTAIDSWSGKPTTTTTPQTPRNTNPQHHTYTQLHGPLLSYLHKAVCPEKSKPVYQLLLEKAASQEEFIPGSLGSGVVSSSGVGGPLMRHVKNYICQRLDMAGMGCSILWLHSQQSMKRSRCLHQHCVCTTVHACVYATYLSCMLPTYIYDVCYLYMLSMYVTSVCYPCMLLLYVNHV